MINKHARLPEAVTAVSESMWALRPIAGVESSPRQRLSALLSGRFALAIACAGMGLLLLFGAGFANSQALHDATHDARHGLGFPCH